jgi:hypothetical protein
MKYDLETMRCSEYRLTAFDENISFHFSPGNFTSTSNRRPLIYAQLKIGHHMLDFSTSELYLNGKNTNYTLAADTIHYTPHEDLSTGTHFVKLIIKDKDCISQEFSWSFIIEDDLESHNFYYGIPHSHTSYSDGTGTPAEAYESARAEGLNFLIITDHQGKLVTGSLNYDRSIKIWGGASPKWSMLKLEASAINKKHKDFIALHGFELSTKFWGHINIINSRNIIKTKPTSLDELFEWLCSEDNILLSVNHPHRSPKTRPFTNNLDNFVNLYEVGNGSTTRVYTRTEENYYKALDEGWHIAAINGQDNHSNDWGKSPNVTAVIAKELSADSLIQSIKLRRVYSTESRSLKLTVKGNSKWMGSILNLRKDDTLEISIHAEDNINPIEKLQIISTGGKIIEEKTFNSSSDCKWKYTLTVSDNSAWYVVKVLHTNGQIGISSPLFIQNI